MIELSGKSWAKILEAMTKASGKELAIAAAPILLAIPGFLDELGAGLIAVGLVTAFLGLRWHVNNHRDEISLSVQQALEKKLLSQEEAEHALVNLKELSTSR